jgi:hypothetical protein
LFGCDALAWIVLEHAAEEIESCRIQFEVHDDFAKTLLVPIGEGLLIVFQLGHSLKHVGGVNHQLTGHTCSLGVPRIRKMRYS